MRGVGGPYSGPPTHEVSAAAARYERSDVPGLGGHANLSQGLATVEVVRILHTSDWHVGRTIRGRSRAEEHVAVLAEIVGVAAAEAVDVVLVVGDLFDSAAPTAESERIVFRALLDLATTGATVVVLAGNHDNDRRLQAVEPLLKLGRVITRPVFARPEAGGVVEVTSRDGAERAKIAVLPFLSQRYVVKAADLMGYDAQENGQLYDSRVRSLLETLCAGFGTDTVNIIAAHLTVGGGRLGGGERAAHTVFEYEVGAVGFPSTAQYVALGHLHRRQQLPGAGQLHYCGSPLQLDFGETADVKAVLVVEVHPAMPARVRDVELTAGRRLRTLQGSIDSLRQAVGSTGDDWLKLVVQESPRIGLADEVRELFPSCVDVVIERPEGADRGAPTRASRQGQAPAELFRAFLAERGDVEASLVDLFASLLEEAEGDVVPLGVGD
jgi:exonuclease SbcD